MVQETKKRQLQWAGHSWRKEGPMTKSVQAGDHTGKRPLVRSRATWQDQIKMITNRIEPGLHRRELALDREFVRVVSKGLKQEK